MIDYILSGHKNVVIVYAQVFLLCHIINNVYTVVIVHWVRAACTVIRH